MTTAAVTHYGEPGDPPIPFVLYVDTWRQALPTTPGGSLWDRAALVHPESGAFRVVGAHLAYRRDRQGD